MQQTRYHILLNASSGTAMRNGASAEHLDALFRDKGRAVTIDADQARPFAERLVAARQSPAPVLVAAGGDGTVTALAAIAVETGKTLAVLPLGTANLLARDLSLPLELEEWFDALDTMVPRQIDVGEVNGRIFLHKVVIGAVPGIAAARERLRGRADFSATIGFAGHLVRRLSRVRRFAAEVTSGTEPPRIERVQSIAVTNNDYAEGLGKVFSRPRLDRGVLSLYLLRHLTLGDALRLATEMLMGRWRQDEVLEIHNVHSLIIRTRWRRIRAMVDGEIELLQGPLKFRIRPLALTVLAPPVADPEPASEPTREA